MAEGERLEAADGALREGAHTGQLQVGQGLAHVALGHAKLDPALLEALREGFKLPEEGRSLYSTYM